MTSSTRTSNYFLFNSKEKTDANVGKLFSTMKSTHKRTYKKEYQQMRRNHEGNMNKEEKEGFERDGINERFFDHAKQI